MKGSPLHPHPRGLYKKKEKEGRERKEGKEGNLTYAFLGVCVRLYTTETVDEAANFTIISAAYPAIKRPTAYYCFTPNSVA